MYRIELAPGEVTVFRTIEELATGVRNGVISPKARIFHGATQKWLPIEFHPHYKAALALIAGAAPPVPIPAPKPAERPSFEKLSFLHPPAAPPAASSVTSVAVAADGDGDDIVSPSAEPAAVTAPRPSVATPASRTAETVVQPHASAAHPAKSPQHGPGFRHAVASEPGDDGPRSQGSEGRQYRPQLDRPAPVGNGPATHPAREWTEQRAVALRQPMAGQRQGHRSPAHAPADLPYLVLPGAETDDLAIDREDPEPPPPARPRPASVMERERPEPVILESAATETAVARGTESLEQARLGSPALDPASQLAATHLEPEAASLPRVRTSPVAELPRIAYPEFTPADAPVAEPASSASRRRRPLQVAVALGLLAIGGYAATLVITPGRSSSVLAAEVSADEEPARPSPAAGTPAPTSSSTVPAAAGTTPASNRLASTTVAAAAGGPLPPASSGFAPALESRAIVAPAAPRDSARSLPADSLPEVEPAAIDMSVPVPAVVEADSLAGSERSQGDSTLRKILRAVNGGKDVPSRP